MTEPTKVIIDPETKQRLNPYRPDWDEIGIKAAANIALRSRCDGRKVGAVCMSWDHREVWWGYNGPPADWQPSTLSTTLEPSPKQVYFGQPDSGCTRWCARQATGERTEGYKNCPSIHAEMNLLLSLDPVRADGGSFYITEPPCADCVKVIANSPVFRVLWLETTDARAAEHSAHAEQFLKASGKAVVIL